MGRIPEDDQQKDLPGTVSSPTGTTPRIASLSSTSPKDKPSSPARPSFAPVHRGSEGDLIIPDCLSPHGDDIPDDITIMGRDHLGSEASIREAPKRPHIGSHVAS